MPAGLVCGYATRWAKNDVRERAASLPDSWGGASWDSRGGGAPAWPRPADDARALQGVVLRALRSPDDIASVLHLRDCIDLSLQREIDPLFDLHERQRDTVGVTVAFEAQGRLVGTIRAVPMCHGLTLTETLLAQAFPAGGRIGPDDWEMGRLVLDPEFRAGPDLLRHCMALALAYLARQHRVGELHASCTPLLARLYRRLGFEVVASSVLLAGTTKNYTLIQGPFARVMAALNADRDRAAAPPPVAEPIVLSHTEFSHDLHSIAASRRRRRVGEHQIGAVLASRHEPAGVAAAVPRSHAADLSLLSA